MIKPYAFFDVDGTLLSIKSMFSFHDFWYRRWKNSNDLKTIEEYEDVTAILRTLGENGASRELINRRYYESFAGRAVDDVLLCARAWARGIISNPTVFHREVTDELESLRAKGVVPVMVSGSFHEILMPIAEHLNVKHILATRLLHVGGKYTGRFDAPQTIGQGKAIAVSEFALKQQSPLEECWAYGDDISDAPMFKIVGHAVAVIGDSELGTQALQRGWRCLNLNEFYGKPMPSYSRDAPDYSPRL